MGCLLCTNQRPDHNRQPQPTQELLMYNRWKANDLLYRYVKSKRERLQNPELGIIHRTVAKYSPCKFPNCKCKGGTFKGVNHDNFGWKNSICTTSGCNHQLSDHIHHLTNASIKEYTKVSKLVFDIININLTLNNVNEKPKSESNILLKGIFESIYDVLNKNIRLDPFTTPNIETIYGPPPFERTNIARVLFSFCMYTFNKDNIMESENALILTKFVLNYFDTWLWSAIPKELLECNSRKYSKSYHFYYCRFLMYCRLPRCVHSISLRYKASEIFGQDVLKYTLKAFRIKLQVWCYKRNIMWKEHTKLFCLNYLPIYMDLLEKEVFNDNSPIWDMDYEQ